jgi:DNA repair protein RecN (Recombination protein N)
MRSHAMLLELAVRNLVIVEAAALAPGRGLTALTGETGAGKSLVLDALALVGGARADAAMVGPAADAATVSAVFEVDAGRAAAIEAACGVAAVDHQIVLRRKLSNTGRSQAWINDEPVTVAALKAAAGQLMAVHAQHEPLRLADVARQMAMLDAFGGLDGATGAAGRYAAAHAAWTTARDELARLTDAGTGSVKELEFLRFQLREFEALQPKPGELAELEARHRLLSEAGTWRDLASEAAAALGDGERSAARVLARFAKKLTGAPDARLAEAGALCQQAADAASDAAARAADAAESVDTDPAALAKVEERLNAWHDLARKHGGDEAVLLAAWSDIARRVDDLAHLDERRDAAAARVEATLAACRSAGAALAKARVATFAKLAAEVHRRLADLGLPKARLSLADEAQAQPTTLGTMRQEFLVTTNPGFPPAPLSAVASGGETSRIALALAATLAAQDAVPLLVFDEVDSGVGAKMAAAIGAALSELAHARTVLVVTHAPHLAACAGRQYVARKVQAKDRTRTTVEEVVGEARTAELAEMLGGGADALRQARSMTGGGAAR